LFATVSVNISSRVFFRLRRHPSLAAHWSNYHTELSYRSIAFYRDSYMSTIMPGLRLPPLTPEERAAAGGSADAIVEAVLRKVRGREGDRWR
jgi:hypothetical protein